MCDMFVEFNNLLTFSARNLEDTAEFGNEPLLSELNELLIPSWGFDISPGIEKPKMVWG